MALNSVQRLFHKVAHPRVKRDGLPEHVIAMLRNDARVENWILYTNTRQDLRQAHNVIILENFRRHTILPHQPI